MDFLNRTFAGENAKNRELCGRKNKNPAPFTMPALTVVRRFCNGPLVVNPFFAPYPLPGSCFCPGSAQGCRLMVFEEERAGPIYVKRVAWFSSKHLLRRARPDPIHRPGRDAASGKGCLSRPEILDKLCFYAAALAASKGVPSASIRCRITASFLASATAAFLNPARLASLAAQLFKAPPRTTLVRITCAAS